MPIFQWDEPKCEKNPTIHDGVTFEEAATVFSDPLALEFFDALHSQSEDRFLRIGHSLKGRILSSSFFAKGKMMSFGLFLRERRLQRR